QYVPQDFGDLELLMQPMRIGGHDIGNQLAKEALEIAHGLAGLVLGQVTGGGPEVSSKESVCARSAAVSDSSPVWPAPSLARPAFHPTIRTKPRSSETSRCRSPSDLWL